MELLSGILCFLTIVNTVYTIKDKIVNKDEQKDVAQFLHNVGFLLKEVSSDLENNIYPHDKCAIMFEYLQNIKQALKNKLTIEQLEKLQYNLEESYRVEKLFAELQMLSAQEKLHNINILKSAAGSFIGIAELLRLGK